MVPPPDSVEPPVRLHAEGGPFWRVGGGFDTPVRLLADRATAELLRDEGPLARLRPVARFPGIFPPIIAMPSLGEGLRVPSGSVIATDLGQEGLAIPVAVGDSVGTGTRAFALPWMAESLLAAVPGFDGWVLGEMAHREPCPVDADTIAEAAEQGMAWTHAKGWSTPADAAACEYGGTVPGAIVDRLPRFAHMLSDFFTQVRDNKSFADVLEVADAGSPESLGLVPGQAVLVLCAGIGHFPYFMGLEILDDLARASLQHGLHPPHRSLSCAPTHTAEGRDYLGHMAGILNLCMVRRQYLTHRILESFAKLESFARLDRDCPDCPRDRPQFLITDHTHHSAAIQPLRHGSSKHLALVHRKACVDLFHDPERPRVLTEGAGKRAWLLLPGPGAHATHYSACHPVFPGSLAPQREAEIIRVVASLKPLRRIDGDPTPASRNGGKLAAAVSAWEEREGRDWRPGASPRLPE